MKRAGALAALVLVAVAATPAVAATARVPYSCTEIFATEVDPGSLWESGGVVYLRRNVLVFDTVGDPMCTGQLTITVNFNLDFATASGVLWGTATSALTAYDGGFTSTWRAHWTNADPLAPDATNIWAGRYVGHGYGELAGWQWRASIVELFHGVVLEDGYAFRPGS